MSPSKPREHKGIVSEVNDKTIKIHLMEETTCATCHIQDSCALSNREDKIVEIAYSEGSYSPGDIVTIANEPAVGAKAIFLGYVLPFLLVVCTLFISFLITGSEKISGLISLGILIPYYFIIYLLRDRLKKTFEFKILN